MNKIKSKLIFLFFILIFSNVGDVFADEIIIVSEDKEYSSNYRGNPIDWRDRWGKSYVSDHITDQGAFGVCWAFTAVADFESEMEFTNQFFDLNEDYSEQQLISCCEDCLVEPYDPDCLYSSGSPILGNFWLKDNMDFLNLEFSFPFDMLWYQGTCTIPECNSKLKSLKKVKSENRNVLWDCTNINLNFHLGDELEIIEYCLYSSGPLIGYFDSYEFPDHSMLIIGTTPGGDLILKNSWGDGFIEHNEFPGLIQEGSFIPENDYDVTCSNFDGDDFCFWGIKGLRFEGSKPASCNDLSSYCGSSKLDCNDLDGSSDGWGCQFSCGNGYCDPWEDCHFCFEDCWMQGGKERSFCCGDNICSEEYGETCDLCSQDCCPGLENGICDFAERCEESNGDCIGGEGGCGFNRLCVEYNPNNGAEQETCAQICDSESNAAWYRIECPRNNNNFQYLDITGYNDFGPYPGDIPHEEEWRCCEIIS